MSISSDHPGYVDSNGQAMGVSNPGGALEPPKPRSRLGVVVAILAVIALAVAAVVVWQLASPNTPATPATQQTTPTTITLSLQPAAGITPVIQWAQSLGGESYDSFRGVAVTSDGSMVAVGFTQSTGGGFGMTNGAGAAMIAMFDSQGNNEWAKAISELAYGDFESVAIGADGSIYAVGSAVPAGMDPQVAEDSFGLVVKLTPTGDVVWKKTFGGDGQDQFLHVVDMGSGLIVVGQTASTHGDMPATHGDMDALVASISYDGDLVWAKTYGGTSSDCFNSATAGPDGTIIAVGASASPDGDFADPRGKFNAVIAGLGPQGDLAWSKVFGGSEYDEFNTVSTAPGGSFFVAGVTRSPDGDLPNLSTVPNLVSVYGTCTPQAASCQWGDGQGDEYSGSTVTTGGLAVAVGGGLGVGSWAIMAFDLASEAMRSGPVIPDDYPQGSYGAAAALPGNRIVAVGSATKNPGANVDTSEYDAFVVIIGFG